MKNLIKIVFILVCVFVSLGTNSVDAMSCGIQGYITEGINVVTPPLRHEIGLVQKNIETSFVTANTQNMEISSLREGEDNFSGGFFDKASTQNITLQDTFIFRYNKIIYSTSHKISSMLKNEICTRAP